MIHYNVYFSLREPAAEPSALAGIEAFLTELLEAGAIAGFRLLRNSGQPPKSLLLPFQALIEFRDDAQFSTAFTDQTARGIHTGLHGRVIALVEKFHVEILRTVPSFAT